MPIDPAPNSNPNPPSAKQGTENLPSAGCYRVSMDMLRLFCEVARLRSFSKGAAALQRTQSAASQAVQQLESQLGQPLVDRAIRPFALTEKGVAFYKGARDLLERYENLIAEVTPTTRSIRISAIYSVGLYDLNRIITRFMTQHPDISVRLEYLRPNKVYEAVLSDASDLGILSYPKADRTITIKPWRREKMVLVCNPGHRLAALHSVKGSDLNGEKIVAFDADLPIRREIDRALARHNARVVPVMSFDNIETMKQAVEFNAGISILPEPTVRAEVESKRLISIPWDIQLTRPVGIMVRRNKVNSPVIQLMLEELRNSQTH